MRHIISIANRNNFIHSHLKVPEEFLKYKVVGTICNGEVSPCRYQPGKCNNVRCNPNLAILKNYLNLLKNIELV